MIKYQGLFFEGKVKELLQRKAKALCGMDLFYKTIEELHVTYKFMPTKDDLFFDSEIGEEVYVDVIGFGFDGENVAFQIKHNDPRYKGAKTPHITMFLVKKEAKARNSGKLSFRPIHPFTIKGKLGLYSKNRVIADISKTAI